jgi:hypothetical protein
MAVTLGKGERVITNPFTGNRIIVGGAPRWASPKKREFQVKYPVEGLHAFQGSLSYDFVWTRSEPIDEADARDAQCRAGYPDTGYSFYSFNVTTTAEGMFRATWCSWNTCE